MPAEQRSQTLRPKLSIFHDYESAAKAVDEMFASAAQQGHSVTHGAADGMDGSDDDDDARSRIDVRRRLSEDEAIPIEGNGGASSDSDEVSFITSSIPSFQC
jgi:hypothetical protein